MIGRLCSRALLANVAGLGLAAWGLAGSPREGCAAIPHLPGAESVHHQATRLKSEGAYAEALREFEKIASAYPEILSFRRDVGYCYAQIKDWPNTYRWLKPIVDADLMDSTSLVTFGLAALNTGKLDEAYRVLRTALGRHPGEHSLIKVSLGLVCYSRALKFAQANQANPAERQLAEATELLNFTPKPAETTVEVKRRNGLAFVLGLRADIHRARGEQRRALELYGKALQLAPDLPGADGWKRLVRQLAPSLADVGRTNSYR